MTLEEDRELKEFTRKLGQQVRKTIEQEVLGRFRGEVQVECFTERQRVNLPRIMERTKRRIYILTTNLDYTERFLQKSIRLALERNKDNSAFKVEILTMDPEGDVANARAIQLARNVRLYRNELRRSLDNMNDEFGDHPQVEIVTYRTLPTQMTFIFDDIVVTSVVSLGQQSREGVHFMLQNVPEVAETFVTHFRALKTLEMARSY